MSSWGSARTLPRRIRKERDDEDERVNRKRKRLEEGKEFDPGELAHEREEPEEEHDEEYGTDGAEDWAREVQRKGQGAEEVADEEDNGDQDEQT